MNIFKNQFFQLIQLLNDSLFMLAAKKSKKRTTMKLQKAFFTACWEYFSLQKVIQCLEEMII